MQLSDIRSLALEITSHCNIKCPQCSRTSAMGELAEFIELRHWNADTIVPNLELDKLSGLKFVRIEGDNGDALMHPDVDQIVSSIYHSANRPNILILTNGSMRSKQWWRNFGSKFSDRLIVQFSIDGLADTNHLYRVGANYSKVIENAQAFIDGGGTATQRCLIFEHNQHQIDDIRKTALSIGFKQLIVRPGDLFRFQTMPRWQVWLNGKTAHSIKPAAKLGTHDYSLYNYNHLKDYRDGSRGNSKLFDNGHNLDLLCPVMSTGEIAITYKGHLIPCCQHHADLYFDHPSNDSYKTLVGNPDHIDLNLQPLSKILSDPNYYGHRLEQSLVNNRLPRCQASCSNSIDQKLKKISFKKLDT